MLRDPNHETSLPQATEFPQVHPILGATLQVPGANSLVLAFSRSKYIENLLFLWFSLLVLETKLTSLTAD